MAIDSPDLSRLNAAERDALLLLASGHTAKSIAALTGRTEGAVHERLREARRKTGIGSSRELARLLRQQENRDDKIGMASPEAIDAASPGLAGGHRWHIFTGVAMIAILAAVGATLLSVSASLAPSQTSPSRAADPLFDAAVGPSTGTLQALREQFDAEARDPVWAPRMEAALAAAYRTIDGLAPGLRIRCASTLCEVAGQSSTGRAVALNRTMQALQGKKLITTLSVAGLQSPGQAFGGPGKTSFVFVSYWRSAKP
jgi:DNA-binding CsgD family transcriptional regulator